jgi:hypothetical protein
VQSGADIADAARHLMNDDLGLKHQRVAPRRHLPMRRLPLIYRCGGLAGGGAGY